MTSVKIIPVESDVKPEGAYVYLHYRADNRSIMYVGKGRRGRWLSKNGRGGYWTNSAKLHGVIAEIVQDNLDDDSAMLLEMWLIAKFRHEGMSLVNRTDGGEGASGFKQSEETKELRASKMRGELHPFYGKKMSKEHRHKLSISHLGKMKGRESPSYKDEKFTFRHIDGRSFIGTRGEFRDYSGLSSGGISRIVLGGRKHEKGWYVSELERPIKEILDKRVFLPDGRLANGLTVYSNRGEKFPNGADAALSVAGPSASGDLIIAACRGIHNTAYGRTWSFNESGPFPEYKDPRRVSGDAKFKKIECSNGMTFIGAKSASEWLSVDCRRTIGASAIYQAIKKGCKAGGYKWRYVDG